jgi:REP element-mobilizing transposase RayT
MLRRCCDQSFSSRAAAARESPARQCRGTFRTLLWRYLAGIGRNHKIPVLAAGGIANHVHLLIALPTDVTVAKAVQVLKANSSRWMGEHGIDFAWQEGMEPSA